ncbi:MAG TPA: methyltransferase domain-containing protein [Phycisphaerae bacterium]|nr:methyltransferase domain-containing protein [Phycisphaerales bacterium]HRX86541.1 methyltransferase domain-containing protein [Phycisphaerae bacterium]
MSLASAYWVAEYAAKARSDSAFVQSGRSAGADPVEMLHTVRRVLDLLAVEQSHAVLDVGCANGLLDIVLSGACRCVTAVERVGELAEIARGNLAGCDNVEVITGDALDVLADGVRFDRILVWEALQLMEREQASLLFERMFAALAPGGRVVLGSVPDERHRAAFLVPYLDGVRRSERLTAAEKAAIIARNERAQWYDIDALAERWRELGGSSRVVPVPGAREKSDHRVDMVLTREAS